jgi:hypothetical protein
LPNGLRYRRLGRSGLENGKLLSFRTSSKKRAQSQPSGAPSNDGGRSFSTGERPVFHQAGKVMIFEEKGSFFAFSGCRSENALLGAFSLFCYSCF